MIRVHDPMVDRDLERRLKASVGTALEANPTERRRARQLRRGARKNVWITQFFYVLMAAGAAWGSLYAEGLEPGGRLGTAAVVAFCIALVRRQLLWTELHATPALFTWSLWPVSNELAFERQSTRGLNGRWVCDVLTVGVCACLVGNWRMGPIEAAGLLVACFALRLVSQAIASVLALSSRWLAMGHIGLGCFLVQIYLRRIPAVAAAVDRFWNGTGEVWSMVLPTGWVLRALQGLLDGGPLGRAAWMVPAGAVVCAMPWALRKMRASYRFRDAVLLQYAAEAPDSWGEEHREILQSTLVNVPTAVSPDLVTRLKSREFLAPQIQAPTALDRLFLRCLTVRERDVLDWAQSGPVNVTRNLQRAVLCGLSGILVAYGMCRGEPGHEAGWFVAAGSVFVTFWVLRAGFCRRAFEPVPTMALQSPRLAFVPVSLAEIARLMVKLALFQLPATVPLLVGLGAGLGWSIGHEPADLARIGLGLGLASPGIALMLLMMPASGPGPMNWRSTLAGLVLVGPPVFGFIGCLAVLAFWESPWAWTAPLVGDLLMLLAFAAFRWMHQRRLFDLIGPVQS